MVMIRNKDFQVSNRYHLLFPSQKKNLETGKRQNGYILMMTKIE
jgi:hypothetical protein